MTTIAAAALTPLRDLALRVQLPSALHARVQATLTSLASTSAEPGSYRAALDTVDACIGYLDEEVKRMTQERFATGDPGAVRQKLLSDPRRAVDAALMQMKQRLSNDRADWSRRVTKQILDIQAQVESELDRMQVSVTHRGNDLVVKPTQDWLLTYSRWMNEVFVTWGAHMVELLRVKTGQLVQPDLDTLSELLDVRLHAALPVSPVPTVPEPMSGLDLEESVDTPTLGATVFESFQGGLNTVGMLAGMVVIPVVGHLMHAASTEVRAIAMGGAVTPVLALAVIRGRSTRRRLVEANKTKATEKIRKNLAAEVKTLIDRFKMDTDKLCVSYLTLAQSTLMSMLEPAVESYFEKRETMVAQEQARVQLSNDRLAEQINNCKSARSALATQLSLELKRKLAS